MASIMHQLIAFLSLASITLASVHDYYYKSEATGLGNAFWTFGSEGVRVYSNDGTKELWNWPKEDICEKREACFRGVCEPSTDCRFYAAASDGHDYVFASKDENGGKIAIFSISRGLYLGSYPTCARPVAIDFAPHREELWVHCFSPDDEQYGDTGHVDIFSTSAWGLDHSHIALPNQTLGGHTHGWIELDAMTPDYAWATTREQPYLAKINVHTHDVETIDLSTHGCAALNEMAISWRNRHLYFKCHVCCSCGVDGDTGEECSESASTVTLNDGTEALGHCGISCDGSAADVVGLIEFDTVSETVVDTHYWSDFGSGDPVVSPDGKYVVVQSRFKDAVKLLAASENGVASSDARAEDVDTDFTPNAHRDTLFVQENGFELAVFASVEENYLVVADLDTNEQSRVTLTSAAETTASTGRLASRSIAWAGESSSLMVSGSGADEVYVVDLGTGNPQDASLIRTISDVPHSFLIHVDSDDDASNSGENGKDGKDGKDAKDIFGIIAMIVAILALLIVIVVSIYITGLVKRELAADRKALMCNGNVNEIKSKSAV